MKTTVIRRILEYLLVFCIILEFNTPYLIFPEVKRMIQVFPIFILLGLLIISNYSITKKVNILVFIYLVGALFPMLALRDHNYPSYIIRYVLILPLLWMYLSHRKEFGSSVYNSLFLKYSNVMVIIAVASLVMWFLCSILQVVPATSFFPYEWGSSIDFIPTYWGVYFETQSIAPLGEKIWRNTGIFNEGPMYNMALCVAFIIEYFIQPFRSKTKLWILAIAIFTTFTTTGQFFLMGIGIWSVFNRMGRRYRILLLLVVPILLYFGYVVAGTLLANKKATGGEDSMNLRTEDITWCMEAGMEHPMLGVGLTLREGESLWHGKTLGRSNSLFAVFARGGLFVLILYIGALLLIPYLYYRKYKDPKWFYAMFCFFLVFTVTVSFLNYLTLLFIAWGMSNINLKCWNSGSKAW
ncbi:O-antigen ligase family protein [Phocaeicola dorei]|jgi:hypothetical protein|nr:O-antigen ligase family protein [Phocaeicola dorei]MCE8761157.1 hypothetical protein [Phocaeicola dorei]MCS2237743.1 hypothetical protein [Phocaeicola dorei]